MHPVTGIQDSGATIECKVQPVGGSALPVLTYKMSIGSRRMVADFTLYYGKTMHAIAETNDISSDLGDRAISLQDMTRGWGCTGQKNKK